jgi:hypothetical protein
MTCLRAVCRWGAFAFCVVIGWLAVPAAALAQGPQQPPAADGGGMYVLPYALVLLGVGLGLLVVCRSTRRRDRARPEQYEESKVNLKE